VGRRVIQGNIAAECSSRALLVADALRGRKRFWPRHRGTKLSVPRFARQAGSERRRSDRSLHRTEGTGRKRGELAPHRSCAWLLRYSSALRTRREGDQLQLDAGRLREDVKWLKW